MRAAGPDAEGRERGDEEHDERWRVLSRSGQEIALEACGDGPVLARHADVVVTADGVEHAVTRPVVALCTCDKSARRPWCDSTHKSIRRPA